MTKLAFFDIDGTLSVPRFRIGGKMTLGVTAEEWIAFCKQVKEHAYDDSVGVKPVRAYAEKLKKEGATLFVLSSVLTSEEEAAKTRFVNRVYPGLFTDCFYVYHDEDKVKVILREAEKRGLSCSDCELVEDTLAILFPANALKIKATHVSALSAEIKGDLY